MTGGCHHSKKKRVKTLFFTLPGRSFAVLSARTVNSVLQIHILQVKVLAFTRIKPADDRINLVVDLTQMRNNNESKYYKYAEYEQY